MERCFKMFKFNPLVLLLLSVFIISCEIPDPTNQTVIEQESLIGEDLNVSADNASQEKNIKNLFSESAVYDVKYTYTVKNCKGLHSEQFNDLTFEELGQVVLLDQQYIVMTRQRTPCPYKVGVYAQWDPSSDMLNDIQGDFLISKVQDWSESYGRVNIFGEEVESGDTGVALSGYIRNIKIKNKETTCTVDELIIDHGLKINDIEAQSVLCEELQVELASFISAV